MAISIPVPNDVHQPRPLAQIFHEILRRSLDTTINPAIMSIGLKIVHNDLTVSTAGKGLVVTTPNGLHTYRINVANNGALESTKLT